MADAGSAEPAWSFVSADDDCIYIYFYFLQRNLTRKLSGDQTSNQIE